MVRLTPASSEADRVLLAKHFQWDTDWRLQEQHQQHLAPQRLKTRKGNLEWPMSDRFSALIQVRVERAGLDRTGWRWLDEFWLRAKKA